MYQHPSRASSRQGRAKWTRAALAVATIATSCWAGVAGLPTASATTPGTPATTQAPTVVYSENFENGLGTAWVPLTGYVGATGMTYTADPAWLNNCNGVISEYNTPDVPAGTGCSNAASWNSVRELSYAAAMHTGSATPATNHSLSAYTQGANPATTLELQTNGTITLPSANRYLTLSVVAMATSCWTFHPLLAFSLIDGAIDVPVFSSPIDPCTGVRYDVPALGGATSTWFGGTFTANAPVLFPGSAVGLRLRNQQTTGTGNDGGVDDVTLLDVTPQLDKSFAPALIARNGVSTLTFTITNTSDLLAKSDWSFTDALPAGVEIAATPNVGGTCAQTLGTAAFVSSATPGATTFSVTGGDLGPNRAYCTITVDVTSAAEGAYANGPSNMTSLVGLNPPGTATLTVRDPRLTLVQALGSPRAADTDQFTVDIRTGSAAGPVSLTSTTTGIGATVTTGTGTAGPLTAATLTPYFLTQSAAGTTSLPAYTSTITCTDANAIQTGLPSGAVYSASFTLSLVAGADVTCVVTSTAIPVITTTTTTMATTTTSTTSTTMATTTTTVPAATAAPTTTVPATTTTAMPPTMPPAPPISLVAPQPLRGTDDEGTTRMNTAIELPVLVNDPSGPTVAVGTVTPPSHGRAEIVDGASGRVRYTPEPGFVGTDTFTYTACAPSGQCITQVVTIHVVGDPTTTAATTAAPSPPSIPPTMPIALAPSAIPAGPIEAAPAAISRPESPLAFTGSNTAGLIAVSVALLGLGVAVLAAARRRRVVR